MQGSMLNVNNMKMTGKRREQGCSEKKRITPLTCLFMMILACGAIVLSEIIVVNNPRNESGRDLNVQQQKVQWDQRLLPTIVNCTANWAKIDVSTRSTKRIVKSEYSSKNNLQTSRPCALLFFGMAKKFRKMILPSIQNNILKVGNNMNCDIFAHTYNHTELYNSRNGEYGNNIDPTEIYELTPRVMMESIAEFESQRNMSHLLQDKFKVHSKHGWEPQSYINMLRQWHSIEQVWKLMHQYENKMNIQYERVGLFRSDVLYVSPIDISLSDAVIPAFGKMTNDRMFYGTYENAYVWANIRFPSVDCYVPPKPTHGLHSEHFMRRLILPNIPNWTNRYDICFFRVRGTGYIQREDCRYNYTGPQTW